MERKVNELVINKITKELTEKVKAIEQCDENDLVGLFRLTDCTLQEFAGYVPTCPIEEQLILVEALKKNEVVRSEAKIDSYLQNWKKEPAKNKVIALIRAYECLLRNSG